MKAPACSRSAAPSASGFGRLGRAREHAVEVAGERRQVDTARKGCVGGVELPRRWCAGIEAGEDRLPALRDLIERDADAEDALGIERRHQAPRSWRDRGSRRRARGLVEPSGEALVLLVGRERDDAAIDQLLVDLSAFDEVARVGVELRVAEDDRHAHLVAARELDVDAVGVLRARREAGIEGRLVPVEVDAGWRLGAVPLGLGRVEGGARGRGEQRDARRGAMPPSFELLLER